ncbi:MAG: EamA family transporter RarD [Novosphingobium sp.]|nr:EamA family transporter RarD [Novosphingobium sp.]
MTQPDPERHGGLPYALGAHLIWGLLPLYLRLMHGVPPLAFVGWRVVLTVPICLAIIVLRRHGGELRAALRDRRLVATLMLSALLIGGNWLVYIAAVLAGHVFATSIGYYVNPLVNVLLGTLFLGERLSRAQWLAVAIAAIGIAPLAWAGRDTLWISLALAGSFSLYGLVRKLAPVGALAGLTIESVLLLLPAVAIVGIEAQGPHGSSFGRDAQTSLLLASSGVITAVPLLLFAAAARRMDYSSLGFVQFLSPTLVFFLSLFVFHEPLRPVQLVSFVLIWTALAVFCWDLLARRRGSAGDEELVAGPIEIVGFDREPG